MVDSKNDIRHEPADRTEHGAVAAHNDRNYQGMAIAAMVAAFVGTWTLGFLSVPATDSATTAAIPGVAGEVATPDADLANRSLTRDDLPPELRGYDADMFVE